MAHFSKAQLNSIMDMSRLHREVPHAEIEIEVKVKRPRVTKRILREPITSSNKKEAFIMNELRNIYPLKEVVVKEEVKVINPSPFRDTVIKHIVKVTLNGFGTIEVSESEAIKMKAIYPNIIISYE